MAPLKINNMLKFYALFMLATGPKHGYELIKDLELRLERKVSASSIYPFLKSLRKNRLIKFNKVGNRDKKIYHLTNEGKSFANKMFNKFGDLIGAAVESKVTVCPCGCKIYSGAYTEKINGRAMRFCCMYCAKVYKSKSN